MFSYVLLFGVMNAISGKNTTISPTSSGTYTYFPTSAVDNHTTSLVKSRNQTSEGSSSVPTTTLLTIPAVTTSNNDTIISPMSTKPRISPTLANFSPSTSPKKSSETITISTLSATPRISPTLANSSPSTSPEKSSDQYTVPFTSTLGASIQTSQTIIPTRTTTQNTVCKEKLFFWQVTTETLKYLFYGTFGALLICIILLIVSCCCWRQQRRITRKLKRKDTMLSNPYTNTDRNNHNVLGFPSPLQLNTFIIEPESTYDTPEVVDNPPEDLALSYVTVIDGNESDSQYAAIKGNGTANSIADGESGDGDCQMSREYTNSSAFDPYEELMPAANRSNEDHYASLIKRDKSEDQEANV